ncbi:MAG TPA: nucleotidyltransferase domain-containing protein [Solirubrobacteraceae bacterium]|jgi:predicted nucleotidyltransferase
MSRVLLGSAERLGCSERTLRRYVNDGLLQGRWVARRLELSDAEEDYLRRHWELLSSLRKALRTEPGVRLAVLFGSTAIGDDDSSSDVDLLIVNRDHAPRAPIAVKLRLRHALDRPVHVVSLEQAETMPTLLADVLREGRVLVDRDELWAALQGRRKEVSVAAKREESATATRAREAVAASRERVAAAA